MSSCVSIAKEGKCTSDELCSFQCTHSCLRRSYHAEFGCLVKLTSREASIYLEAQRNLMVSGERRISQYLTQDLQPPVTSCM